MTLIVPLLTAVGSRTRAGAFSQALAVVLRTGSMVSPICLWGEATKPRWMEPQKDLPGPGNGGLGEGGRDTIMFLIGPVAFCALDRQCRKLMGEGHQ